MDLPPEPMEMGGIPDVLAAGPAESDWLFVSPALGFGAHVPGERLGRYRVGGVVAQFDADGVSAISGADFALAVVDEIESPSHRRAHIGVAY